MFYAKNDFYFIPDGKGGWKKTNPKLDQDRVTRINQEKNGNVLNIIRIIKYWNSLLPKYSLPSYLLETIILNYCEHKSEISKFVDIELPCIFSYIAAAILSPVYDQKGIQGDINNLPVELRNKISRRITTAKFVAEEARDLESDKFPYLCLEKWSEILGDNINE